MRASILLLVLCVGFDIATRKGVGRAMQIDLALVAAAAIVMGAMDRLDHRTTWTEPRAFVGPVVGPL